MGGEEKLEEPSQSVWIMMLASSFGPFRVQVSCLGIKKGCLSARDGLLVMHIPVSTTSFS